MTVSGAKGFVKDMMNYAELLEELEQASLFDVYRLQAALGDVLEHPVRLARLREQLTPGQEVTYFDAYENRHVKVRILDLKRTRVSVQELESDNRYTIPMYWINVENADLALGSRRASRGIARSDLRVGDKVGFHDRDNVTRTGEVIRRNPKTATLLVDGRSEWRVSYGLLFDIIDGQPAHRKLVSNIEVLDA